MRCEGLKHLHELPFESDDWRAGEPLKNGGGRHVQLLFGLREAASREATANSSAAVLALAFRPGPFFTPACPERFVWRAADAWRRSDGERAQLSRSPQKETHGGEREGKVRELNTTNR